MAKTDKEARARQRAYYRDKLLEELETAAQQMPRVRLWAEDMKRLVEHLHDT